MKCKKIVGFNGIGYLIELEDGRYAVVGLENKNVTIEILKETFLKYDAFDMTIVEDKLVEINRILIKPKHIEYGFNAREYLINPEIRQKYENLIND